MRKYFGTDGIRFIYSNEVHNTIKRLANSLSILKAKQIIIGIDTRSSSLEILNIFKEYIPSNIKIRYVEEISTPGICFLSLQEKCLGLIITASHNDHTYNGIKIFNKGFKLKDEEINLLEEEMDKITSFTTYKNKLISSFELKERYISFLLSFIKPSNLKIAFDAGNGATSSYLERIAITLNKDNHVINNIPNGTNINEGVGALYPNVVQDYVIQNNLDYGFCFDGDADRVILVDKDNIYRGDQLLYLLSNHLELNKNTIVITPYSNKGLKDSLSNKNIKTQIVPPGDENILSYLLEHKLSLGGEDAGHIIIPELLPTGDGLLNAIIISNILNNSNLKEEYKDYLHYPSKTINLKIKNKDIINNHYINACMRAHEHAFGNDLEVFMRMSGTENVLRVYACHKSNTVINFVLKKLITAIKVFDNNIITSSLDNLEIDEKSIFGNNVTIEGNTIIKNSKIDSDVSISSSYISDSTISDNCVIGPYAHIHKKSFIGKNNRIGNYTEVKNSITGHNTKAAHLTYIGDAFVGSNVNFGCGSIIVNYDGKNKTQSVINDGAFIGSNVNIISPLVVGKNCFIAAGTTLTKSTKDNSFIIGRNKETIKEDKALDMPYYKNKKPL